MVKGKKKRSLNHAARFRDFNKTIIPLVPQLNTRYMIIANQALRPTLAMYHFAYPTRASGILGHFRVAVNLEREIKCKAFYLKISFVCI